jgi:hypothetical protein
LQVVTVVSLKVILVVSDFVQVYNPNLVTTLTFVEGLVYFVLNQFCSVLGKKFFDVRNLFNEHILWLIVDFFIVFSLAQDIGDLAFFGSL